MVLTQRRKTQTGWCYIDWMVLHRLDGANTEAEDIDQMVLHRLDGANTEVEDTDWMVLTQRWETETGWC